jgi:pyrimidine-nucleoside phosphorylase
MDQPLGRYVGNAAEVLETLQVLAAQVPPIWCELTRVLGGEMLRLGGVATEAEGQTRIMESLRNGEALQRLQRCAQCRGR